MNFPYHYVTAMSFFRLLRVPRLSTHAALALALLAPGLVRAQAGPAASAPTLPPLPDSSGWGVHVLTVARDPGGALWVGTYGQGIYRLPAGGTAWESIRRDSSGASISTSGRKWPTLL